MAKRDPEITFLKKKLPKNTTIERKGKDIVIKSSDRLKTKSFLEGAIKKAGLSYKFVLKKTKSTTVDVMVIKDFPGDIIFKPTRTIGSGGLAFEDQLKVDLEKWVNGHDNNNIQHKDVIKKIESVLGWNPNQINNFIVLAEGIKKTKRRIIFNPKKNFNIENSSGKDITDLTVKMNFQSYYLSLKSSPAFYIIGASVIEYFNDKAIAPKFCEFFGLNGLKMGGFGPQFVYKTNEINYSNVKLNLESVLSQAYGKDVIFIHKKRFNDVSIIEIGDRLPVTISDISENSYVYPEPGIRKYASIKCIANVGNKNYKADFQFRGMASHELSPKNLGIVLRT